MIYRRDIVLGMVLLAAVAGVFLVAVALLVAAGGDGFGVHGRSVALIEIQGAIFDPMPVVNKLERYMRDDDIPAIVIRLNTPGGGISATQEIYETIVKTRMKGKIVIASMGSVAASGGYYIAAACDSIVATPGTITGSIGVIANFSELSDLFDKIGITFNTRKSGQFKDTGSISRKMRDDEKELIDSVIMDSYDQFLGAVCLSRSLDEDHVRQYADGRVFTGRQAKEYGFVDILGTYQDAVDLAGDMTGLGFNPPVVEEKEEMFWEMLMESMSRSLAKAFQQSSPGISYLWRN